MKHYTNTKYYPKPKYARGISTYETGEELIVLVDDEGTTLKKIRRGEFTVVVSTSASPSQKLSLDIMD